MNLTSNKQRNRIYALLDKSGLTTAKADLALGISQERTEHISELYETEADSLIVYLTNELKFKTLLANRKADRMRKKILHLLALQGYITEGGKFDYPRINHFIENIGSRNPDRKKFNKLSVSELREIVTQVEKMASKPKKTVEKAV